MKNFFLSKLFKSDVPAAAPAEVTPPSKTNGLNTALTELNDEFVTLNFKLLELKSALQNLRDSMQQLEAANRRRAEVRKLTAVPRSDLN